MEMGARKVLRTLAVTCLALIGGVGVAEAAPADRASDPVVLKGADLPSLRGSLPGRVVAFRWAGRWKQIPVQVDERHRVSARTLYPAGLTSPTYVTARTFDVEVYADPKTRSGPDENRSFDRNDELVFMAGDTGRRAPASARTPTGTVPGSAIRLRVNDPAGGGRAWVYLFRNRGRLRQSAGRDYVKYSFRLDGLAPGRAVRDRYRYQISPNPEDSSVTTRSYRLHSVDRWMEDELRVRAGRANRADILDREAVSGGGLAGCGRSEFTMSGNWNLDINPSNDRPADSDEGTYLAIKDGPVRAIRSFMGANSGPYVERDHFYYADLEATAVYLRVHPLPDLYVWTDLSDRAIGMTYRDAKNPGGVAVDGVRDTPDPFTAPDFSNGRYVWQQVTGTQGTVTTMTGATTDLPEPAFTSYYLDAADPGNGAELQCGGDLKAFGAHGFGITGVVLNTDPVWAPIGLNHLRLDRIRYFSGPGGSAARGEALNRRANRPLTAAAVEARIGK